MSFASIRKQLANRNWLARWRSSTRSLGRRGERTAAKHLKRQRFRILARNYRCAAGEIDLICRDADTFVFVEVKTRSSDSVQDIEESVRGAQWRRVQSAARFFLMQHRAQDRPSRFDFVAVLWNPGSPPSIEHFKDVHPTLRR